MFWLGLIIPISYIPLWTGQDILTGWSVLSIALPFLFLRRVQLGIGHYLGIAFLAYATLSMLWTENKTQGVWDLWILGCLAGCFLLGATRDLRPLILGTAIGLGINDLVAIPQAFGWAGIYETSIGLPAGLFVNRDIFGETAVLVSIGLLTQRLWWPLVLTLPPIAFTGSRTALVACFVCGGLWLWEQFRWRGLFVPLASIPLLGLVVFHHGWDGSVALRLAMWQDTIGGLTWFGHGPGSFFSLYPEFAVRTDTMATRPEDPHNDYLGFAFQYGLGAIPLFGLLATALASRNQNRYILLGFLTIACFDFPWRMPIEGLLGMAALGSICRSWALAWLERYNRGPIADLWKVWRSSAIVPVESIYSNVARIRRNHA